MGNRRSSASPLVRRSKFLSLVLRHRPETVGLELGEGGWVEIDVLLAAMHRHGKGMSREDLEHVVANNDKKRFAFDATGLRIRAVQGHSKQVELGYVAVEPPVRLYHGTVARVIEPIRAEGLKPGTRQHVHLSPDRETATIVGARRGKPVVLTVDAATMHGDGHDFFQADNGVWLTAHVPPRFIVAWE